MRMSKQILMGSFLVLGLSFCGGGIALAQEQPKDDVMKILSSRKELSKFVGLISEAGLKDYFSAKEDSLTVFAPTDDALSKAPSDVMKRAKADKEHLVSFVKYHTINGSQVFYGNVKGRRAGPSAGNGEGLAFEGLGKDPLVNTAKFVTPDLRGQNGVVHVMDKILIPPSIAMSEEEKVKQREKEESEMRKREEDMMKAREDIEKKRDAEMMAKKKTEPQKAAEKTNSTKPSESLSPTTGEVSSPPGAKAETKKSGGFLKMLGF